MNVLDALLGTSDQGRDELVVEGTQAKTVLRKNDWVFIPPHDGPALYVKTNIELGNSPEQQLYNLSQDVGQIKNVAAQNGKLVNDMSARLEEILSSKQTRGVELETGEANKPDGRDGL